MPLTMIHLAVGQKLISKLTINSINNFYVGSIAPDAIHMRDNTTREDKKITHIGCRGLSSVDKLKENISHFYKSELSIHDSRENISFVTGYCAHVITDYYWSVTIFRDFMNKIPVGLDDKKIEELYYSDADLIDSKIFHWSDWVDTVFSALSCSGKNSNQLLKEKEISKWTERILNWYPDKRFDPDNTTAYLEYDSINNFINKASEYVNSIFIELDLNRN